MRRQDERGGNFVDDLVAADIAAGKNGGRVMTRFPPEPNGYLHIGHAKSICLNFGLAQRFPAASATSASTTRTRRPRRTSTSSPSRTTCAGSASTGDTRLYYASDYFEKLYEFAEKLIEEGKAYVDSRSLEEIRATRGDFYKPGEDSPLPEPHGRREPRPLPAHARRRVPRRRARPPREDRHGVDRREAARPGHVPHPPRAPPPHRRHLVHLPDVRLGARPVGRDRGGDALDLHARVREPPPALPLVSRRARAASTTRSRSSSRASTSLHGALASAS